MTSAEQRMERVERIIAILEMSVDEILSGKHKLDAAGDFGPTMRLFELLCDYYSLAGYERNLVQIERIQRGLEAKRQQEFLQSLAKPRENHE